jgi:hypothetical protein
MFVLKGKRRRGSPVKATKGLARGRPKNAKRMRRNAKGYSQSDQAKKFIADQNSLRLDAQMNASLRTALQSTGGVALEKAHLVDQFWDRVRQERAYKLVILRADKRIVDAIAFVYMVFETICSLNDWHRELHIQKLAELTKRMICLVWLRKLSLIMAGKGRTGLLIETEPRNAVTWPLLGGCKASAYIRGKLVPIRRHMVGVSIYGAGIGQTTSERGAFSQCMVLMPSPLTRPLAQPMNSSLTKRFCLDGGQ